MEEKKISIEQHNKHKKLKRPDLGKFTRTEFAFMGTTCDRIDEFYSNLKSHISPEFTHVFIDGDHNETQSSSEKNGPRVFQFENKKIGNEFDDRLDAGHCSLALINGNHYLGRKQILFLDSKKSDSIRRNIDKITEPVALVEVEKGFEVFPEVIEKFGESIQNLPRFSFNEPAKLAKWLNDQVNHAVPELKALILIGGKSERMGMDKSQIEYHGMPQFEYLANLCEGLGLKPHLSIAHNAESTSAKYPVINDKFIDFGAYGAILSAFVDDPDSAWLVLACDLPYLNEQDVKKLVQSRNPYALATAAIGEENPFPEPLIAIYEPAIYPRMLQFLSLGYTCPRKVLINSNTTQVAFSKHTIQNINTFDEYLRAKEEFPFDVK